MNSQTISDIKVLQEQPWYSAPTFNPISLTLFDNKLFVLVSALFPGRPAYRPFARVLKQTKSPSNCLAKGWSVKLLLKGIQEIPFKSLHVSVLELVDILMLLNACLVKFDKWKNKEEAIFCDASGIIIRIPREKSTVDNRSVLSSHIHFNVLITSYLQGPYFFTGLFCWLESSGTKGPVWLDAIFSCSTSWIMWMFYH